MSETDLIKLYSGRILELAADIPRTGRLDAPQASATCRSPLCGSNVTVDLSLTDGRISEFAQDVRACALGQAAASVVGANIIGCSRAEIGAARDQLAAMLTEDAPPPDAPFSELEVLIPARAFTNRHRSILLALDATAEAMDKAARAACA
ncbi:MAG: iron-sulfur cluster assembly scaffold protein [Rhodobacteraceae bacterium]|jgi:NifU-like protein involved in Fe-S cluster formation|nr:iron-sulfur cluster assembly scaffold protein [Alphaproteobacteria bacterium]MBT8474191.1 iron-sulfur cluster assembly scaffold protein [Alphaproteobacteria bacterium]NNK67739.1 iron-sulfur cluster assembly scaffold protein [Paracoccaceae bacterium]